MSYITNIEGSILRLGIVIKVGNTQWLHWSLSNPTQDISQKHVDPHWNTGLSLTAYILKWNWRSFAPGFIVADIFLTIGTVNALLILTSRGEYGRSVTCPDGLRWACWTWREVICWIHWRSNWCFNLIAAYKIPMWLLNEGREQASGIVRYSQCEAYMNLIAWLYVEIPRNTVTTVYSQCLKQRNKYKDGFYVHTHETFPTGQWWNGAWQSRRFQKTSEYIPLLWSWVGGVWHQNSSRRQSPTNSLSVWNEQKKDSDRSKTSNMTLWCSKQKEDTASLLFPLHHDAGVIICLWMQNPPGLLCVFALVSH